RYWDKLKTSSIFIEIERWRLQDFKQKREKSQVTIYEEHGWALKVRDLRTSITFAFTRHPTSSLATSTYDLTIVLDDFNAQV
uniref:Uncharacterized protein n=1 Tax=Megaselia scalaris TaxID=36166 RepID=T1GZ18_MEGSC